MRNHSQIVKSAPPRREIADKCGVSTHAVGSWITRNSIPAEHFKMFADEGWATLEELAIGAARSVPASQPGEAA